MRIILKLIKADVPGDQIVKDGRMIHLEQVDGGTVQSSQLWARRMPTGHVCHFFSKVILCDTVKTLRGFGYQVYLNNIRKEI